MLPSADLFSAVVADKGFRWHPLKGGGFELRERGDAFEGREYFPLRENPALFRTFASLKPKPAETLDFANQYGRLLTHGTNSEAGERLAFWRAEIEAISACVQIAAQAHRVGKDTTTIIAAAIASSSELRAHFMVPGLSIEPTSSNALAAVRAITRRRLTRWTEVTLVARNLPNTVMAVLPLNLLGALWLQFAESLSTRVSYRQCAECGEWFEVSRRVTGASRAKRFCSSACRLRHHRTSKNPAPNKRG